MSALGHYPLLYRNIARIRNGKRTVGMSALGHKQTSAYVCVTSALPPIPDLDRKSLNVRDVP
jgi:hypothetical protein